MLSSLKIVQDSFLTWLNSKEIIFGMNIYLVDTFYHFIISIPPSSCAPPNLNFHILLSDKNLRWRWRWLQAIRWAQQRLRFCTPR